MQHDDRRPLAGNPDMNLGAVVGDEVRHGGAVRGEAGSI